MPELTLSPSQVSMNSVTASMMCNEWWLFFMTEKCTIRRRTIFFRNDEYMRFESCTLISVKLVHHKNVVTVFEDFELSPLS
jgi:hypothetical protein